MRVFVSSTVYDLIDVRAEVAEQLRSMGIVPVLSDDKLSGFDLQHGVNSIETCLSNVGTCDEVVVILDKRYGPSLADFGYGDFSATHLEYRRAVELKIPIRFYVRDRLHADFAIWRKNKKSESVALAWISEKERGILRLLDDHSKLQPRAKSSNWYYPFTSSIDLKAALSRHFEKRILPSRVVEAIQNNSFPIFNIGVVVQRIVHSGSDCLKIEARLTNIGQAPAFNVRMYWKSANERLERSIVSHGQSLPFVQLYFLGSWPERFDAYLIAEYQSAIGVSIHDQFEVNACMEGAAVIHGGNLTKRTYRRAPPVTIEFEES